MHPYLRQAIAQTHIDELGRVADQRRAQQSVRRALFGRRNSRPAQQMSHIQSRSSFVNVI